MTVTPKLIKEQSLITKSNVTVTPKPIKELMSFFVRKTTNSIEVKSFISFYRSCYSLLNANALMASYINPLN